MFELVQDNVHNGMVRNFVCLSWGCKFKNHTPVVHWNL